jgi:hypothetical protein
MPGMMQPRRASNIRRKGRLGSSRRTARPSEAGWQARTRAGRTGRNAGVNGSESDHTILYSPSASAASAQAPPSAPFPSGGAISGKDGTRLLSCDFGYCGPPEGKDPLPFALRPCRRCLSSRCTMAASCTVMHDDASRDARRRVRDSCTVVHDDAGAAS